MISSSFFSLCNKFNNCSLLYFNLLSSGSSSSIVSTVEDALGRSCLLAESGAAGYDGRSIES
jgi:hypothetical protein